MIGGAGHDTMTGGGGRDRYLLVSGDGFDHIVDFDFRTMSC